MQTTSLYWINAFFFLFRKGIVIIKRTDHLYFIEEMQISKEFLQFATFSSLKMNNNNKKHIKEQNTSSDMKHFIFSTII